MVVQVYIYCTSSKNDRIGLKFFVDFLFLATIVQMGVSTYYAWQILVVSQSQTGFPLAVFLYRSFIEAASALTIINGITSAAVQIFFSWQIWFLNRTTVGRIFAVLIGIIAISQLLTSITSFSTFHPEDFFASICVWLAGNFAADVLIALSMLYAVGSAGPTVEIPTQHNAFTCSFAGLSASHFPGVLKR
ncbi:hypothetical protein BD779DRAFT_1583672 [Infundibulicybe gibba]|nr:hypothetical protein BD779DRAFT_1583672 [Infundibulicybe gibba]